MSQFTMKNIAACAYSAGARGLFCLFFGALTACSALKVQPRPVVYDFGPGAVAPAPVVASPVAALPALVLAEVDAPVALESGAVLYRLAYADSQQLRPYAHARWSMPPAQLFRQRLREQLGLRRAVLNPTQGVLAPPPVMTLHIELEEFSQLFETADHSSGLLRLRATLGQGAFAGQQLVAQRSFVVQRPASGADAAAGVRALTAAVDAVIQELDQWVGRTQATAGAGLVPEPQGRK